jgi:hypothetical protein
VIPPGFGGEKNQGPGKGLIDKCISSGKAWQKKTISFFFIINHMSDNSLLVAKFRNIIIPPANNLLFTVLQF